MECEDEEDGQEEKEEEEDDEALAPNKFSRVRIHFAISVSNPRICRVTASGKDSRAQQVTTLDKKGLLIEPVASIKIHCSPDNLL